MPVSANDLLIRIRGDRKSAQRALQRTRREVRGMSNDVRSSRVATTAMTGSAQSLAVTLGAAGGVAYAFGIAAKAAVGFESEMKKIEVLVGINTDLTAQWASELRSMAPELGRGPRELAQALFVVTSAGERTGRAMEIVRNAAMASAVGLGETKEVARAVTSAMQAYRKSGLDAATATDILVTTVREGNLEASDLAGSLGRVLGIASSVGVEFQQVGSFVATFTRLGVSAEEAVTALRGILTTVAKPSKQAREALAEFGMTVDDLRRSIREDGLAQTLVNLVQTIGDNQDAMTQIIPNVRALAGVLGTAGAQSEEFLAITASFDENLADTRAAFASTSETAEHALSTIKAQAEVLKIEIGEGLIPTIKEMGDAAIGSGEGIRTLGTGLGLVGQFIATIVRTVTNAIEFIAATVMGTLNLIVFAVGKAWNAMIWPINKGLAALGAPIKAVEVNTTAALKNMQIAWDWQKDAISDVGDAWMDLGDQSTRFQLALEGLDPALVTLSQMEDSVSRQAASWKEIADALEEVPDLVLKLPGGLPLGLPIGALAGMATRAPERAPAPAVVQPEKFQFEMMNIERFASRASQLMRSVIPTPEEWAAMGEQWKEAMDALGEEGFQIVNSEAIRFKQTLLALDVALWQGRITQEQYAQAVADASRAAKEATLSYANLAPQIANLIAMAIRAAKGQSGGGIGGFLSGLAGALAPVVTFFNPAVGATLAGVSMIGSALSSPSAKRPQDVRISGYSSNALRDLRTVEIGPREVILQIVNPSTGEVIDQVVWELYRRERRDAEQRIPTQVSIGG